MSDAGSAGTTTVLGAPTVVCNDARPLVALSPLAAEIIRPAPLSQLQNVLIPVQCPRASTTFASPPTGPSDSSPSATSRTRLRRVTG